MVDTKLASKAVVEDISCKLKAIPINNLDEALAFMQKYDESLTSSANEQEKAHIKFLLHIIENADILCLDTNLIKTELQASMKTKLQSVKNAIAVHSLQALYDSAYLKSNHKVKGKVDRKTVDPRFMMNLKTDIDDVIKYEFTKTNDSVTEISYISNLLCDIFISKVDNFMIIDHKISMLDIPIWKDKPSEINDAIMKSFKNILKTKHFDKLTDIQKEYLNKLIDNIGEIIVGNTDKSAYNKRIILPITPHNENLIQVYDLFIETISKIAAIGVVATIKAYIDSCDQTSDDMTDLINEITTKLKEKEELQNATKKQLLCNVLCEGTSEKF